MKRIPFALFLLLAPVLWPQSGGTLRMCVRAEPKTFDPLLVADEPSETVRYLTGGVLIRLNRKTQALEPALALSWKVTEGGRRITFQLRPGVRFSDGTPFGAADAAATLRRLFDPAVHSPTADPFRAGEGRAVVETLSPASVSVLLSAPVAGLEALFDQVAIEPARGNAAAKVTLGPFHLAEYKSGQYIQLQRNPHYWKRDAKGRALPCLDAIRIDIQPNREIELLRFRRGELHLINKLDAEMYERLSGEAPQLVRDAGVSLESEQMWFNQVAQAPLPEYKKAWFGSREFRAGVSQAINRQDLCRIVFRGRAHPAAGPVSAANRFWFNQSLKPHACNPPEALRLLQRAGFRMQAGVLSDRAGNAVEFSVITNSGNKQREKMAALIQQDLKKIGIRLNVVALDFPSLIERIARTWNYEACLLGLVNVDLDPNGQMNVWLSSASNHQWNPSQAFPATPWEAEIDRLMKGQAATVDNAKRKTLFDAVQKIAWEQAPFLYLVNRNALAAAAPEVGNLQVSALHPQAFWNADELCLNPRPRAKGR
ncbi:MAG: ABC transporter substrate-binding protein [Acidobacteria bacterium]|nr:ABC transporter substrate-binding protein [Acidobacteriota bacterium]